MKEDESWERLWLGGVASSAAVAAALLSHADRVVHLFGCRITYEWCDFHLAS